MFPSLRPQPVPRRTFLCVLTLVAYVGANMGLPVGWGLSGEPASGCCCASGEGNGCCCRDAAPSEVAQAGGCCPAGAVDPCGFELVQSDCCEPGEPAGCEGGERSTSVSTCSCGGEAPAGLLASVDPRVVPESCAIPAHDDRFSRKGPVSESVPEWALLPETPPPEMV